MVIKKSEKLNKRRFKLLLKPALLAGMLILPLIIRGDYYRHILIFTLMYVTLAQAWNITGGYVGQIALGNAVFFATGAYTSVLLVIGANISPWVGMLIGGIFAVVIALALGSVVLKLKGAYFAMATIAIAEIIRLWFSNWKAVGGAQGLSVPLQTSSEYHVQWYYMQWENKLVYYYIILAMALLATLLVRRFDTSKYGSYAKAIKQDEIAARSRGVNSFRLKQVSFAITAFITALVGTYYAQYIMYISPQSILLPEVSVMIAIIPIVGGVGTVWGPILGAVFIYPLTEFLRSQLGGKAMGLNYILFALSVIFVVVVEPRGFIALKDRIRRTVVRIRGDVQNASSGN